MRKVDTRILPKMISGMIALGSFYLLIEIGHPAFAILTFVFVVVMATI